MHGQYRLTLSGTVQHPRVDGIRWPPLSGKEAWALKKTSPFTPAARNYYISEYIRKFGCMVCKQKPALSSTKKVASMALGARMHRRALTEDGKLLIVCASCSTRAQYRDLPDMAVEECSKLLEEWKQYVDNAAATVEPPMKPPKKRMKAKPFEEGPNQPLEESSGSEEY